MKVWMRRGVVLLIVILVGVLLAGAYFLIPPPRGPRRSVPDSKKGSLHLIQGMKVLCLKGDPYSMGFEYGRLLQGEIQELHGRFNLLVEEIAQETFHVPPWVARKILDVVYRCCGSHIPSRYRRELEGLADGAEVPLQDLRRLHVLSVLTERACSSFAVFGQATADGKVYHSRNFDWTMEIGMQDHPLLVVYKPDKVIPFVNIGYAGWIGCLSGMNAQGISIGHIGAISDDKSLFGTPMPFLIRRLVEEASSLDDAARIVTTVPRTVGHNYVIADGQAREAIALETCRGHCAIFRDNDPKEKAIEYAIPVKDAIFRADEAMDPEVRKRQRCANGYPNMPYGSNSYEHRYRGMADRIKENYGRIDAQVAEQIVRDTAMRDCNLHWVLYAPTDLKFWVAHANGMEDAWKQPCQEFSLEQLLALFEPQSEASPSSS